MGPAWLLPALAVLVKQPQADCRRVKAVLLLLVLLQRRNSAVARRCSHSPMLSGTSGSWTGLSTTAALPTTGDADGDHGLLEARRRCQLSWRQRAELRVQLLVKSGEAPVVHCGAHSTRLTQCALRMRAAVAVAQQQRVQSMSVDSLQGSCFSRFRR